MATTLTLVFCFWCWLLTLLFRLLTDIARKEVGKVGPDRFLEVEYLRSFSGLFVASFLAFPGRFPIMDYVEA